MARRDVLRLLGVAVAAAAGAALARDALATCAACPRPPPGPQRPPSLPSLGKGRPWPGGSEDTWVPLSQGLVDRDTLEENRHPLIVFKDEEHTGDDRYMTREAMRASARLAELVAVEWPGQRLRVTDAYDRDAEHAAGSTHYAGRGLDMTTSDRDLDKIARLGGLATASGFDWVYNEGSHIHASVR